PPVRPPACLRCVMKWVAWSVLVLALPSPGLTAEQERVLAEVKKWSCDVEYAGEGARRKVVRLEFGCHSKVPDDVLAQLKVFPDWERVEITGNKIPEGGVKPVASLPNLRWRSLTSKSFPDKGVEHLKGLTRLRELELMRMPLTDRSLEHLTSLTGIESLSFW